MRPVFVKIVSISIRISPSYPIFAYCDEHPAHINLIRHPRLMQTYITFCNRLAASQLKLASIYPEVL